MSEAILLCARRAGMEDNRKKTAITFAAIVVCIFSLFLVYRDLIAIGFEAEELPVLAALQTISFATLVTLLVGWLVYLFAKLGYGLLSHDSLAEIPDKTLLSELLIKAFDIAGASVCLILLSPLFLAIACLIRTDSSGTILFRQLRIGLNGELFPMLKFRTMKQGAEQARIHLSILNEQSPGLFKIRHDPRVTRVGKFLRRTSLDELPQLFNVLMGQMSLVGPRPLPVRDIEELGESRFKFWLEKRASVLPGITGLWQVNGRSELNTKEMAELDISYIERRSLAMNFIILLKTIPAVVAGRGAY
jgi:lipopolysaccharide/colanic/teichoic acid biosynthesis glycosyltransferase